MEKYRSLLGPVLTVTLVCILGYVVLSLLSGSWTLHDPAQPGYFHDGPDFPAGRVMLHG